MLYEVAVFPIQVLSKYNQIVFVSIPENISLDPAGDLVGKLVHESFLDVYYNQRLFHIFIIPFTVSHLSHLQKRDPDPSALFPIAKTR